ncbi:MAG: DUF1822 family protein [Cyanobacteria bacterium J06598_3]
MATPLNWPTLPIPISRQWRKRCEQHAHSEPISTAHTHAPKTAETKVAAYQQTLATLAVQYYLRMINVPHRLKTLPSGLTLYVEELGGYLTCCPLPPDASKCVIRDRDRTDRKGYFFVELSEPYHQAQILGFVKQVSVSELPLSYLRPLSSFVEALQEASEKNPEKNPNKTSTSTPVGSHHIPLIDWAQGLIASWQPPQNHPPAIQPAQAMRSSIQQPSTHDLLYERYAASQGDITLAKALTKLSPAAALTQIIATTDDDVIRWHAAERLAQQNNNELQGPNFRVKSLINDLGGLPIALLVGTMTKPDRTFLIGCRLYRLQNNRQQNVQSEQDKQYALPGNLVLQGIEEKRIEAGDIKETGQVFFKLTPATHGDPLEYLFTAEAGDCFSLRVDYQQESAVNTFIL